MVGRALFAFVWVIIAAGVTLPLYSGDVVTSVVSAASGSVQPVAASGAFGCEDCPVPDAGIDCASDCPCDRVLPAGFVPLEQGTDVTFAASGRLPARLPAKLPAI